MPYLYDDPLGLLPRDALDQYSLNKTAFRLAKNACGWIVYMIHNVSGACKREDMRLSKSDSHSRNKKTTTYVHRV